MEPDGTSKDELGGESHPERADPSALAAATDEPANETAELPRERTLARTSRSGAGFFTLLALCFVALALRDTRRFEVRPPRVVARHPLPAVVTSLGGERYVARGRVETSAREPIEGALVSAVLVLEGRSYPVADVETGTDGSFLMPGLPAGSYHLVARAPGRARRIESLRVHGGDPASVNFVLGAGATIAGTVVAAVGRGDGATTRPLADVVVRAASDGGGDVPHATRTDENGAFVLEGLPAGSFRVEVSHAGYEPVVRRAIPAPSRGLAITLRELSIVRGIVVDGAGRPAPGAQVVLAGSGIWPPRSSNVRPDGRFEVVGIPAGVYELRAQDGEDVAEPVAPLVLEPGDARDVTLTVTPGATLAGTVVDAQSLRPIARARVIVAEDALATAPRAIVADANGAFRATGLLRRSHQVSAQAEGYVARLGVVATPGVAPVQVPLDREVVLTGRVVDSRGAPVAGAQLEVIARDLDGRPTWLTAQAVAFRDALFQAQARGPRPLIPAGELGVMPGPVPIVPIVPNTGAARAAVPTGSASLASYVTDAQGMFRIAQVPPGVVSVAATHPAFVRGETAHRAARAGETLEVEIVLHPGGNIAGRVVDDRGFPVAQIAIEARVERDALPRRVFSVADGTFRIPAVLGRVAIVALVGGRVAARAEADVADDAEVPITLTLDREIRRVRGRVLDARGFPVRGAEVTLGPNTPGTTASVRTISVDDGTFDTVVPGTGAVNVEVRHPGFALRALRGVSDRDEVSVTLEEGGALAAQVRGRECEAPELSVEIRTVCGPIRRTVRNGEGDVRAEHLCPGRVQVLAQAAGCVRAERSGQVVAGQTLELAPIELVAGGGASGEVVDDRGDPVPDAVVALTQAAEDAVTGTARTDRRGAFTVRELPDGDHELVATHPLLGRSRTAPVRVYRGSVARGIRLTFDRALADASRDDLPPEVSLALREGHLEVRNVAPGSSPLRAGLQPGDELVSVQGREVRTVSQANALLAGPMGDEVTVEVVRDGERRTVRWVRELIR